jgi:hypothetical protein
MQRSLNFTRYGVAFMLLVLTAGLLAFGPGPTVSRPGLVETETPAPTSTPHYVGFLPFLARPAAISGRVTFQGQPAADITLGLYFFDGMEWSDSAIATTTTDSDGRYRFVGQPALGPGEYYGISFGPNETDERFLAGYDAPAIGTYTGQADVPGGDFDIANVVLNEPRPGAQVRPPVTFRWTRRGIAGDSFRLVLVDSDPTIGAAWETGLLGDIDSVTLDLPPGAAYNHDYYWSVDVNDTSGGWGYAFNLYRLVFVKSASDQLQSAPGGVIRRATLRPGRLSPPPARHPTAWP